MRGQVVAVATALQESGLRNLPFGDRDSLGLFQQRPSQGWGTPTQILDPGYAAGRFYVALLTVPGWQRLPVAAAAQAVQRSAVPDAYARWDDEATGVVAALSGTAPSAAAGCGAPSDAGTTMTPAAVRTVLAFAAAQVGDSYVLGATGPDSWDCSSLVQAAYTAAGVALPRTAAAQYGWLEARGQLATGPVRLVALRPGDLLFSRGAEPRPATDGQPVGHVALYAGAGVVLEAKGWADGVTAQRYSDRALTAVTAVGRVATTAPTIRDPRPIPVERRPS